MVRPPQGRFSAIAVLIDAELSQPARSILLPAAPEVSPFQRTVLSVAAARGEGAATFAAGAGGR